MKKNNKIIAIGLNPALQKLLTFKQFQAGQVNRAATISYISGGKAANFAKAAANFGSKPVIYQFSGGATGTRYCKILDSCKLPFVNQQTEAETRTCSTIMNSQTDTVTEIIEPSGMIHTHESKQLLAKAMNDIHDFQGIALCGTYPPGIDATFYAKLANQAFAEKIPLLLDACQSIELVLKEGVEILKINLDELKSLSGIKTLKAAVSEIFSKYTVKIIAITDGPKTAHLFAKKHSPDSSQKYTHYEYVIPKLENVINPIGAGDTVSAVLLTEYIAGVSIQDAFKTALAAGSASCLTKQNALFDVNIAKKMAADDIKLIKK